MSERLVRLSLVQRRLAGETACPTEPPDLSEMSKLQGTDQTVP